MKKIKGSNDLHTILFPHSYLREQDLNKLLPIFGSINIFQPWFMAPPDFMSQKDYQGVVRVLNPASHMQPGKDFKGLLSEYKTWMKHNRDKSMAAFIKLSQDRGTSDESSWEIRSILSGSKDADDVSESTLSRLVGGHHNEEDSKSLKWHLILHLSQDLEIERQEADRLLKGLKEGKSPIEDLLGEEAVQNPLTDLSQFESEAGTMPYPLERVFNAWFGLFSEYLKSSDPLLTISRQVMDYATEVWDTSVKEPGEEPESLIRLKYPDLSDRCKRGELGNPIRDLGKDYQNNISRLKEHAKGVGADFHKELEDKPLHVTVKCFSPPLDQSVLRDNRILQNLSGKVLILVEA